MRIEIVDGATTRELRRAVLRPGWPVGSPMHGDDNPAAVHLAARDDSGTVIGCCLVLPRPYPNRAAELDGWQLRGMATAPDRQGQGVGTAVLAVAVDEIIRRGAQLLWCDARTSALRFYAQHGFRVEGEEFMHEESGILHYRMWRPLPSGL